MTGQLLVDLSVILRGDSGTGIQRVVRGLWKNLADLPPDRVAVRPILCTRWGPFRYAAPEDMAGLPPAAGGVPRGRIAVAPGDMFLGLDFSPRLLPRKIRQLRRWQKQGVALHLLVHDLLPLTDPQWFTPAGARNYRHWFRCLAVDADHAICNSRFTATELRGHAARFASARRKPLAISTLELAGDIAGSLPSRGRPDDGDPVIAWMQERPSVVMIGSLEPRKGHDLALDAFEALWARGRPVNLLLVGKAAWMTDRLQRRIESHAEFGRRLIWLRGISDEFLLELLDKAAFLLFASSAEGFGLPIAEARFQGCRVLARDLPVFHEFSDAGVTFFDMDDPVRLSERIVEMIDASSGREVAMCAMTWKQATEALTGLLGL